MIEKDLRGGWVGGAPDVPCPRQVSSSEDFSAQRWWDRKLFSGLQEKKNSAPNQEKIMWLADSFEC